MIDLCGTLSSINGAFTACDYWSNAMRTYSIIFNKYSRRQHRWRLYASLELVDTSIDKSARNYTTRDMIEPQFIDQAISILGKLSEAVYIYNCTQHHACLWCSGIQTVLINITHKELEQSNMSQKHLKQIPSSTNKFVKEVDFGSIIRICI